VSDCKHERLTTFHYNGGGGRGWCDSCGARFSLEAVREINRLREIKKTLSLQAAGLLSENEQPQADNHIFLYSRKRLQARVEELEALLHDHACPVVQCPGHHITDEQIDAAWAFVIDPPGYLSSDVKKAVEAALWAFDIKQCEGCGGEGKRIERMICGATQASLGPMRVPCPDCNGHGWVKHD